MEACNAEGNKPSRVVWESDRVVNAGHFDQFNASQKYRTSGKQTLTAQHVNSEDNGKPDAGAGLEGRSHDTFLADNLLTTVLSQL